MTAPPVVYRFGRFRVDTGQQSLTRDDAAIAITPKVFDTLVVFLQQPGRLLTRDHLLSAVWGDTSVEEANLTVNVSTLRRLLDDGDARPCIETVPRRGYRFVAPVAVDVTAGARRTSGRTEHPRTVRAQELYARANQAALEADHWETARDLYQACLDEDPEFAPAWARMARCLRVIAKYTSRPELREASHAQAGAAFERALTLDPVLPLTHGLYAQLEVDLGRAPEAMVRLLRLIERDGPDATALTGLVHALRFCGLLDASRAAHRRARKLEATVATSVAHTCWLQGDYQSALLETAGDIGYMQGLALASLAREADAVAALRWRERDTRDNRARAFLVALRALLQGEREESLAAIRRAEDGLVDPEARYYLARMLVKLGEHDAALAALAKVVDGGFTCPQALADGWFDGVRATASFAELGQRVRIRHAEAAARFAASGGAALV